MSLPRIAHPSDKVTLTDGTLLDVHGLTVGQARALREVDDAGEADALCIAWATDTPVEEARAWVEVAPARDVEVITSKAVELSRVKKGAEFQGATGDDAAASRPAE